MRTATSGKGLSWTVKDGVHSAKMTGAVRSLVLPPSFPTSVLCSLFPPFFPSLFSSSSSNPLLPLLEVKNCVCVYVCVCVCVRERERDRERQRETETERDRDTHRDTHRHPSAIDRNHFDLWPFFIYLILFSAVTIFSSPQAVYECTDCLRWKCKFSFRKHEPRPYYLWSFP